MSRVPSRRALAALLVLAACGGPEADGTADEIPLRADGLAPAPGVYPFQGVWAGEGAACEDRGLGLEGGPLTVTTQSVGYGDPCSILAVEAVGAARPSAAYDVTLSCAGGGVPSGRTQRFAVDGDMLTITDADGERRFARCAPAGAEE